MMQGMILAAGLGTRLKPVTDSIPKALVEIRGKTLLQWNIERLVAAGCHRIVVNVHHFPELIRNFLSMHHFAAEVIISDESDEILDTGGGLLKAAPLFHPEWAIVVHNVDVISNLNIQQLLRHHRSSGALATLVVRDRATVRYLLFDDDLKLSGWLNRNTGETRMVSSNVFSNRLSQYAFSGIHIVEPSLLNQIPLKGRFSLVEAYLNLAENHPILGYPDGSTEWLDVGKPDQLEWIRKYYSGSE